MSADPACRAPVPPEGAVPRTCVPFAHVPAVPVVAVPYVPVPVPSGLPVLSVAGILPDRAGNVDVTRFLEEWAAGPLADKADKAPPAAAGNLASLDASGNLADSGATPESIKAAAVAAVVNGADATMDTLKEIADILGSSQQSGTILKRISDLEAGKADWLSLAVVATSGSYDDLRGKPTIPTPVPVDATLATEGSAADAKAVGDALRSGFTEWEFTGVPDGHSVEILRNGMFNSLTIRVDDEPPGMYDSVGVVQFVPNSKPNEALSMSVDGLLVGEERVNVTATRHLITPTKTSQLTNDGDGTNAFVKTNDARLSNARTPTAHHATHAANGSDPLAPADIGAANAADLPYRLVTPGEWEFSDGLNRQLTGPIFDGEEVWYYYTNDNLTSQDFGTEAEASAALSLSFGDSLTATRASLPGHLLDRAGNRAVVSGDTTLTLPAANPGYLRDFLVRLEISGSTVPTITFAAPTGETLTYETDGDEFPVPDEAGAWLYSFTESCVAHKFAVALKKVNTVAQGGS